jgi:hypothetical protein
MARRSLDLIDAMVSITEAAHPISEMKPGCPAQPFISKRRHTARNTNGQPRNSSTGVLVYKNHRPRVVHVTAYKPVRGAFRTRAEPWQQLLMYRLLQG